MEVKFQRRVILKMTFKIKMVPNHDILFAQYWQKLIWKVSFSRHFKAKTSHLCGIKILLEHSHVTSKSQIIYTKYHYYLKLTVQYTGEKIIGNHNLIKGNPKDFH